MKSPNGFAPTYQKIFVTQDQLDVAMAHPDYSTFTPFRNTAYGIDGYIVTFGRPALNHAARLLDERRARHEAAKRGDQA